MTTVKAQPDKISMNESLSKKPLCHTSGFSEKGRYRRYMNKLYSNHQNISEVMSMFTRGVKKVCGPTMKEKSIC